MRLCLYNYEPDHVSMKFVGPGKSKLEMMPADSKSISYIAGV